MYKFFLTFTAAARSSGVFYQEEGGGSPAFLPSGRPAGSGRASRSTGGSDGTGCRGRRPLQKNLCLDTLPAVSSALITSSNIAGFPSAFPWANCSRIRCARGRTAERAAGLFVYSATISEKSWRVRQNRSNVLSSGRRGAVLNISFLIICVYEELFTFSTPFSTWEFPCNSNGFR